MKNKILIFILCFLLILCGCTHNETEMKTTEYTENASQSVPEEIVENTAQFVGEETTVPETEERVVPVSNNSGDEPEISVETTEAVESESEDEAPPVEVQENSVDEEGLFCTLVVKCDSILQNIEKLKEGKLEFVPENGIIFSSEKVKFEDGETVFEVLKRELIANKIHFEFSVNPMYKSSYIEGIANIYEFDCGDMSGWLYTVNGKNPNAGCSQYVVEEGDSILFYYNCR